MPTITPAEVTAKIKEHTKGKIFGVLFLTRKKGGLRQMTCRMHVRKHLVGGERPYDPTEHNLIFVFDVKAKGYRSIPIEGILELRFQGLVYTVELPEINGKPVRILKRRTADDVSTHTVQEVS